MQGTKVTKKFAFKGKSVLTILPSLSGLVFYDTKVAVMNKVLNATVQRTIDHAAPEITLDPLEIVGGMQCIYFVFTPLYLRIYLGDSVAFSL